MKRTENLYNQTQNLVDAIKYVKQDILTPADVLNYLYDFSFNQDFIEFLYELDYNSADELDNLLKSAIDEIQGGDINGAYQSMIILNYQIGSYDNILG